MVDLRLLASGRWAVEVWVHLAELLGLEMLPSPDWLDTVLGLRGHGAPRACLRPTSVLVRCEGPGGLADASGAPGGVGGSKALLFRRLA